MSDKLTMNQNSWSKPTVFAGIATIAVFAFWGIASTGWIAEKLYPERLRSTELKGNIVKVVNSLTEAQRVLNESEISPPSTNDHQQTKSEVKTPLASPINQYSEETIRTVQSALAKAASAADEAQSKVPASTLGIAELGQYGDMFGGVTSLYTALTLVVAIYVAKLQHDQTSEFLDQSKRQKFESLYILLMEQLRSERSTSYTYSVTSLTGAMSKEKSLRNIMLDLREKWLHLVAFNKREESNGRINDKNTSVEGFIRGNAELLECCHIYFRIVYRILSSIDESDLDERSKKRYALILRDSLVQSELTALVINGCSDESPKLNELLLRYEIMKNVELDRTGASKEWQNMIIKNLWKQNIPPTVSPA